LGALLDFENSALKTAGHTAREELADEEDSSTNDDDPDD